MQPRLSLVTLGVADVARSRAFYERLGFKASSASSEHVAFFDAQGVVLALFSRADLAADAGVAGAASGFSGVSLAHNVSLEEDVARVLAEADAAGATIVKPARKAVWGGRSGYFADPDGHLWEVAWNPFMPLDAAGHIRLPDGAGGASPSDQVIAGILQASRTFVVIGASDKPSRPSYGVMGYLKSQGYEVIPVNPLLAGHTVLGLSVKGDLAAVDQPVDVVDIFRNSAAALDAVRAAVREKGRLGIKVVWMQVGVINEVAAAEACAAGLVVIMDRCPKIEHARLFR
ncbi:CoA-binding protein [Hyphomicrobium sp.]|uniref:CoA-binding protein n=1 Tax=Hyphomicrobium sp. TaxID=82 RepID=UPI002FDE8776